jgi:hypothetical protein
VLVTANSVGVMRSRLASDRLNATAVAATATTAVSSPTTSRLPAGRADHGGAHTSIGMLPTMSPHAVTERDPTSRTSPDEPSM